MALAKPWSIMLLLLASAAVSAQAPAPAAAACPKKQMDPPSYPVSAMKSGVCGRVVVSLASDACGRVTDARIEQSSRSEALDAAVLAAASHWVLGPSPTRKPDERQKVPIEFHLDASDEPPRTLKQVGWPKTHRYPRYVPDASGHYASVADVREAIGEKGEDRAAVPPYDIGR